MLFKATPFTTEGDQRLHYINKATIVYRDFITAVSMIYHCFYVFSALLCLSIKGKLYEICTFMEIKPIKIFQNYDRMGTYSKTAANQFVCQCLNKHYRAICLIFWASKFPQWRFGYFVGKRQKFVQEHPN